MAQQITCRYCLREYPADRAGGVCDGCGAALVSDGKPAGAEAAKPSPEAQQQADGCTAVLARPAASRRRRAVRYGALATFALLLAVGFCLFSWMRPEPDAVEVVVVTVEAAEPEPVPDEPAEWEFDDDILFFYRAIMGEMNFLLGVLEGLGDGEMEMDLDEFYQWMEEEDVLLSQYGEILERLEQKGVDVQQYAGLLEESLALIEDLPSVDFLPREEQSEE